MLRMFAETRGAAARLDSQGITRERSARIGNRAADLRMLDRAPVVPLLVMRNVEILLGGMDEAPRNAVRLRTVEAFFAVPMKLHAPFYIGYPTQMLFPITGRHSDYTIVFLSAGDAYWVNAPLLKTTQPLLDALKALGY